MTVSHRLRRALVVLGLIGLSATPRPAAAQTVPIKLATVVPENSIWDKSSKQMAGEWKQATGGRVAVTVFSGGSQGDESTRACARCGSTPCRPPRSRSSASPRIDPAFNVFNVPFFFNSYDELNAVVEKLTPTLKQRVEAKGFVLVQLGTRRLAAGVLEEAGADAWPTSRRSSCTRRPATTG